MCFQFQGRLRVQEEQLAAQTAQAASLQDQVDMHVQQREQAQAEQRQLLANHERQCSQLRAEQRNLHSHLV